MNKMSNRDRAKQFAPFAALKGFEEAIKLQEKESFSEIILAEDAQAELNQKLLQLECGDEVTARYYANGEYRTVKGQLMKIDTVQRRILIGETRVPIDRLMELS